MPERTHKEFYVKGKHPWMVFDGPGRRDYKKDQIL